MLAFAPLATAAERQAEAARTHADPLCSWREDHHQSRQCAGEDAAGEEAEHELSADHLITTATGQTQHS
jgi:hypothetical protein